ncbi:MAG: type transport system permease protein [Blastocatellia bacterium]|jgi:ABC-2 type transport system permease protein|nr:type transport system permease protein [Blastocatellia bacterium]
MPFYDSENFSETRREQNEKAALRKNVKMKSPFSTPFGAIFQNEVRLNSKRIAPYFMALLCAGNALLWWGWGPATGHGWAVNADFFIAGVLPVYSFLTLPLFTALFMADPILKDFRAGIDPLIFSKPISRSSYLLGKFFGNFFVLACCQSAFVLTSFVLQAVSKQGVITQDWKVFPYIKHFLVFVVISHLGLAAFYFAVGVLTRNAKIVYGLGVAFYPLYIAYQTVLLSSLPWRWKLALDPLAMNRGGKFHAISAEVMNHLVVVYDTDLIVNRAVMVLLAAICLTIIYVRFTIAERPRKVEELSVLNLTEGAGGLYYDPPSTEPTLGERFEPDHSRDKVLLPSVTRATAGARAHLQELLAALGVELRLLLSERSLVVIMPLAIVFSTLDVAFWSVAPEPSFSAAYAGHTANAMLLFLLGITIFYSVEALHRDREHKIEPLLWSQAAPNYALLLSKFLATLVLTFGLIALVGLITIALQLLKHNGPVELSAYLGIYSIILIPNAIFLAATVIALGVVLRDRYVTYVFAIGLCAGLFYLYSQGHNGWLYNPLLFQLWKYSDLTGGGSRIVQILAQRIHLIAIAMVCLSLAHLFFRRPSNRGLLKHRRLTSSGWPIVLLFVSLAVATVAGLLVGVL